MPSSRSPMPFLPMQPMQDNPPMPRHVLDKERAAMLYAAAGPHGITLARRSHDVIDQYYRYDKRNIILDFHMALRIGFLFSINQSFTFENYFTAYYYSTTEVQLYSTVHQAILRAEFYNNPNPYDVWLVVTVTIGLEGNGALNMKLSQPKTGKY